MENHAFIMENHLFISYAHSEKGWVTQFHKTLEGYLFTNLGVKPRIWRDDELRNAEIFATKIVQQLPVTGVLVSVLSERYFKSEWCVKEVHEFCRVAEENKPPGLVVNDTARILQVMLKPFPPERKVELDPVLKDSVGYSFYKKDEESDRMAPLYPAFGKEYEDAYNRQIFFLAEDVAELINKIEETNGVATESMNGVPVPSDGQTPGAQALSDANKAPAASKPAIYLAECSYDQREDREKIRGALRDQYVILPDQALPRSEKEYIAEVGRLLDTCKLSIHLVGTDYGWAPDGPRNESCVVLQNEIAVEKSKANGLQRVIWVPDGAKGEDERQEQFITALHEKADAQYGADLLTESYQKLLGAINATLEKIEGPPEAPRMVYVICDEKDRKATVPLRKYLKGKGFEVRRPVFDAEEEKARQAYEKDLAHCDAVILFYGDGDEAWKREKKDDLKDIAAYRGEKPMPPLFTYLAAPTTDDKEDLIDLEEPNLIDGLEDFSETAMEAFLAALGP